MMPATTAPAPTTAIAVVTVAIAYGHIAAGGDKHQTQQDGQADCRNESSHLHSLPIQPALNSTQ
jgi:hypothetical protein